MPTFDSIVPALIGGVLIGSSVVLYLLGAGRIAGISGIFGSLLAPRPGLVRVLFLVGLLLAPWLLSALGLVDRTDPLAAPQWLKLLGAGLLVGVGTQLGTGCTSGHGVCGISNLSLRGFTATLTFMAVAILVVALGFGGVA